MYRRILVDVPIGSPDGLLVVPTGEQAADGQRRLYYAAQPPLRLLIVMRGARRLEDVRAGQCLLALLGWDEGDNAYVLPGNEGKRHSKLTIDRVLDADPGGEPPDGIRLSEVLARAPRSDRPGGWRADMPGRPPVQRDDRVEQHNVSLPSRLWRRIEEAGEGNRSAGIRNLIGQEVPMSISLPHELRQMLLAWPGATAAAADVNGQAAIIVKAERRDVSSAHRPGVPVAFQSQIGLYETGAAIRLAIEIRDRPDAPLKFDTFLDPGSEHDLELLRKLRGQAWLDLHLFDMRLNYQYTKHIPFRAVAQADLAQLLDLGLDHVAGIPAGRRNFAAARDRMMQEMPL